MRNKHSKIFLINAANLHVGGGVQVAVSFIYELARRGESYNHLDLLISTKVSDELKHLGVNTSCFGNVFVEDHYGPSLRSIVRLGRLNNYSAVFTVFGPLYYPFRRGFKSIVGFAQPWIIYPDSDAASMISRKTRAKIKIRSWIQKWFFRKEDVLIVELDHVKEQLSLIGFKNDIRVVRNAISDLYFDEKKWLPADVQKSDKVTLGLVSRDYSHKNLSILPEVKKYLSEKHNFEVRFLLTLTDEEWQGRSDLFKESMSNVGPLYVNQCPRFYEQLDGVVFPSLLECFSATPLESIYMGLPLFASNRPFIRDVCGKHAVYFDPLKAEDVADKIYEYFSAPPPSSIEEKRKYVREFSSAAGRADMYLKIMGSLS